MQVMRRSGDGVGKGGVGRMWVEASWGWCGRNGNGVGRGGVEEEWEWCGQGVECEWWGQERGRRQSGADVASGVSYYTPSPYFRGTGAKWGYCRQRRSEDGVD